MHKGTETAHVSQGALNMIHSSNLVGVMSLAVQCIYGQIGLYSTENTNETFIHSKFKKKMNIHEVP